MTFVIHSRTCSNYYFQDPSMPVFVRFISFHLVEFQPTGGRNNGTLVHARGHVHCTVPYSCNRIGKQHKHPAESHGGGE